MKIVSFSPSATRIVKELGLSKNLVGRSDFCDIEGVPVITKVRSKSCVSHIPVKLLECELYKLEIKKDKLQELNPALVIFQSNYKNNGVDPEDVKNINLPNAKLFEFAPTTFQGIFDETIRLANELGKSKEGENFTQSMGNKLVEIKNKFPKDAELTTILVIDNIEPLTVAGFWTTGLINEIPNFQSLNVNEGEPSRFTTWNEILYIDPDYLFIALNNTSLPETQSILNEINQLDDFRSLRAFKSKKVIVVDGKKHFNVATPEIVNTLNIIGQVVFPQIFSDNLIGKEWAIFY